ncbi:MAG: hypothetical protein AB9869_17810 [Verrucomicrobiia bacterium]
MRPKTFQEWADAEKGESWRVSFDQVGSLEVSTVFLGIAHSGLPASMQHKEKPDLFETMVFGMPETVAVRYKTWAEAEQGHRQIVGGARERWLPSDSLDGGDKPR